MGPGETVTIASGSTVTVGSAGELRGTGTSEASRDATLSSGGNYSVSVSGTLEARYFAINNLGTDGVVISNGAFLNDLDYGTLNKATVGGATLDLSAVTGVYRDRIPYSFEELSFTGGTSSATNVQVGRRTPVVRFFGSNPSNGALWGEPNDTDPGDIAGFGLGRAVWHSGALRRMTSETGYDVTYDTRCRTPLGPTRGRRRGSGGLRIR
jgi:hypothetical protein